ncbi:cation diffusion facilitator family transporter [Thermosipho atlanticus]|uniref:Cation diffusion facilitator family transporter n=1 Tax=Thermosipho atlanticus DSM 15807 TaxID=1123380 RepID=A0A1M5S443_9BACT|nr:cation diffusion facilitator family transporter [Thermosipho atlanticus]SHH33249.1 cation diffusion facilitator family transporter [Thermosipho atlanticus DSM 15807]
MEKSVKKVTIIAVLTNSTLAFLKVFTGLMFNSMAVLADGIDSSTDIFTSLVVFFATRFSSKPPDKLHPYGHQKVENIAAKIISFVIFYAGISLLTESFKRLITGNYQTILGIIPILVTIISMAGKFILFIMEYKIGKKYQRQSLIAEALNMRNDILLSTLVFFGVFLNKIGLSWADPVVGMIMSIIILKVSFEIFSENFYSLMDGIHPKEEWLYDMVFENCKKCDGVYNPHKVRIRKIGNKYDIDLDIEVDPNLTVKQAHEITKCLRSKIIDSLGDELYDVVIHVEPLLNDEIEPYGLEEKK